jgi:hypothetical protein
MFNDGVFCNFEILSRFKQATALRTWSSGHLVILYVDLSAPAKFGEYGSF